jgi:hypothetical protein
MKLRRVTYVNSDWLNPFQRALISLLFFFFFLLVHHVALRTDDIASETKFPSVFR